MSLNRNDRAQSHSRSPAERRERGVKAGSMTVIQRGRRKSPNSITASHPPPRLRGMPGVSGITQDGDKQGCAARWKHAAVCLSSRQMRVLEARPHPPLCSRRPSPPTDGTQPAQINALITAPRPICPDPVRLRKLCPHPPAATCRRL